MNIDLIGLIGLLTKLYNETQILIAEIQQLRQQNEQLQRENEQLKQQLLLQKSIVEKSTDNG